MKQLYFPEVMIFNFRNKTTTINHYGLGHDTIEEAHVEGLAVKEINYNAVGFIISTNKYTNHVRTKYKMD